MQTITLEQLKELERKEYNELIELQEYKSILIKRNDEKMIASCEHSIIYQTGRWGMLTDLIEQLEKGN